MSVNLTRSVCGIVIDGNQIDTTPELLVKNPEKAGIVAENRGISENAVRPNRTYKKDTEGEYITELEVKKMSSLPLRARLIIHIGSIVFTLFTCLILRSWSGKKTLRNERRESQ
jgi:hypothetical protein